MKTGTVMKLVWKQTVFEGSQFVDRFPEPGKRLVVPAFFPYWIKDVQFSLKPSEAQKH